jgi:hypothetical protein
MVLLATTAMLLSLFTYAYPGATLVFYMGFPCQPCDYQGEGQKGFERRHVIITWPSVSTFLLILSHGLCNYHYKVTQRAYWDTRQHEGRQKVKKIREKKINEMCS